MKIGILGNSVSLIMRPPRANISERTYAEILEKEYGYIVCNAGKRGAMINDAYGYLEDEIIRKFPDVVIVHFGIVEAATRIRTRFFYKHSERQEYKNSIFLSTYPYGFFDRLIDKSLLIFAKCMEYVRGIIGKRINWLTVDQYEYVLEKYTQQLLKEISCEIILIGIGNPGHKLESLCPGTCTAAISINAVMEKIASRSERIHFIDIYHAIQMRNNIPDGSHFNSNGHRFVANKILEILERKKGEK